MSALSKSKIQLGLQCEKALYLSTHSKKLKSEVTNSEQMIFDQGHEVGLFAQTYFPNGVTIDARFDQSALAIQQTEEAIQNNALTIYEATFSFEEVLVKIDILHRKNLKGAWEIVEVKSSTQVKGVHLTDAAIQYWVCLGKKIKVSSVQIMTINNECEFPNLKNFFDLTDVTKEVKLIAKDAPKAIARLRKVLAQPKPPEIDIGPHCADPYPCAFSEHCFSAKKVPTISVFDIPKLSTKKKWEYYQAKKVDLKKLNLKDFNDAQKRMIECTLTNKQFIDCKGISRNLKLWTYPLSFLDFESIGFAIPRYDGQRPYQQAPFQFSCHYKGNAKSELVHCEYLHSEDSDSREAVANALVKMVPKAGSVVSYNMSFEGRMIIGLAELFPKLKKDLLSIKDRLVDPLPIFREFVYDPKFAGSFSIKYVAPAILGKNASYDGMKVGDGSAAQAAYLKFIHPKTSLSEKVEIKSALIEYCKKDTYGMVQLVDWLFKQV